VPLNLPQQLFLSQARSDYEIYGSLARRDVCHRLHYLQMCTEKLSKVWFWRLMSPPTGGHSTFEPFLRALTSSGRADFHQMFGYTSARRFALQWPAIQDLALKIQNLAPGPVNPNPEYPWPRNQPTDGPLNHPSLVLVWQVWSTTTAGRRLRCFVENLLRDYLAYFP
jgi:hypothetical protein